MTVLLAIALTLLAAGYTAWPLFGGRAIKPLADETEDSRMREAAARVLRAWSAAAGERGGRAKGYEEEALDPEDLPK